MKYIIVHARKHTCMQTEIYIYTHSDTYINFRLRTHMEKLETNGKAYENAWVFMSTYLHMHPYIHVRMHNRKSF